MTDWLIDDVVVPGDLEWIDRSRWSPTKQAEDLSLAGGVIVQRSTQTAGRPLTIETSHRGVFVTYATVLALEALRDDVDNQVFEVTEPDGVTKHTCRFRHSDGQPVDAAPLQFRSPPHPDDIYNLTIRLMIL